MSLHRAPIHGFIFSAERRELPENGRFQHELPQAMTDWLSDEEFDELEEQYTPEITRQVGEMARQVGGHGGMDTIMDWRMIDCIRNGIPLDMDVYDAALWSAIGPLSEWSTNNTFEKLEVPDFTSGAWETNEPGMDINLERGGSTRIMSKIRFS
jgi:hypothetical protein